MKQNEYLNTFVYKGHMINLGIDDNGQQFFIEYMGEDGTLKEESCGAYNSNYMDAVEFLFGDPKDCEHYGLGICENVLCHGYCGECPYNTFVISRNIRMKMDKENFDKE